jgi:adenylyltransferase/sulfurtransferase
MLDINPHLKIEKHEVPLTSENALDIVRQYDIVADGTDNFPTRYLVNDACVLLGKPNVYGSIFRFEGQSSIFATESGPCYRCLYPEPPPPGLVPSCAEGGVLGILPGVVGLIQATEVVKLILGQGTTLEGRLMLYDALNMKFRELKLRRNPECPSGKCSVVQGLIDYQQFCGVPEAPAAPSVASGDIEPRDVKSMIDSGEDFILVDVREPHEHQIASIPQATLIPLGQLPNRLGELPRQARIVCHCKSGMRSAKAVDLLKQNGFARVSNMKGGILAWSDTVDPRVPKY